MTLLCLIELIVYVCLKTEPSNEYEQYVAETLPEYANMFAFIFSENLKTSLRVVALGIVPFFLGSATAGYLIFASLISALKWLLTNVSLWDLFLCILPHGIFEFTAIFFSVQLSVFLSRTVTMVPIRLFKKEAVLSPLKEDLLFLLRSIVLILIPLFLIAAGIEETVSEWATEAVLSANH